VEVALKNPSNQIASIADGEAQAKRDPAW
jgi:hypothetical protein